MENKTQNAQVLIWELKVLECQNFKWKVNLVKSDLCMFD